MPVRFGLSPSRKKVVKVSASPLRASGRRSFKWTPYLLIAPALLYLLLFFAWPMTQAIRLAVWEEQGLLSLRDSPGGEDSVGTVEQGARISVMERRVVPLSAEESDGGDIWFFVEGKDEGIGEVRGWIPESRIRIRETDSSGAPVLGTVRPRLGASAGQGTVLHETPDELGEAVGELPARAEATILRRGSQEVWYLVKNTSDEKSVSGWAQGRNLQIYSDGESGRVGIGDTGRFTLLHVRRMLKDRFFRSALWTTFLLMLLIIPVQLVLAIVMALVIQSRIRFNLVFLAIFAIPLAASDLAVGIVWSSIFTQNGFLNSLLYTFGLISSPQPYLTAATRHWILVAVWIAEVWRATSLVMVIVVSGLQAISQEVLEAAELFGASLWQRVRYVILPLLKPSIQVALILRTILALQVFAVVIALGGGDVVTVLANETYRQYYALRNMNAAAAYSGLILLLSMVSAVFYLRTVRGGEEAVS